MANGLIRNAVDVIRWEGIQGVGARALSALGIQSIDCYRCKIRTRKNSSGAVTGAVLIELSAAQAGTYCLYRRGAKEFDFLQRIRNGSRCFVLMVDEWPVSSSWISVGTGHMRDIDLRISLGCNEVYLWDSYTPKSKRGLGWQTVLFQLVSQTLCAEGFDTAITMIERHNRANISSRKKQGFRWVGHMRSCRWSGRTWLRARGRCLKYSQGQALDNSHIVQ